MFVPGAVSTRNFTLDVHDLPGAVSASIKCELDGRSVSSRLHRKPFIEVFHPEFSISAAIESAISEAVIIARVTWAKDFSQEVAT